MRVGRRLVIRPTWREFQAAPDDVVLALDPGMAFGTGLHPTTRLCLAGIEAWADAGKLDGARLLDVGTGSGILAIGALLLGANSALGVDTDELAVETTRRNAELNALGERLTARQGSVPLETAAQPFDLVTANLIASLLVDLAEPLAASVRVGGRLLASGIFIDREREVRRAFEEVGLRVIGRRDETEWVALEAERTG